MIDYIRNLKRIIKMAEKENKDSVKELFLNINARIGHIEDAMLDNRDLMLRLVKQSNQIVKFLQTLDIEEDVTDEFPIKKYDSIPTENSKSKARSIKELIDEFMSKHKDLKEFEEELKKVKKLITPGQVGEA